MLLDVKILFSVAQRVRGHALFSQCGLILCTLLILNTMVSSAPFGGRYEFLPVRFLLFCLLLFEFGVFFFLKDGRPLPKIVEE